MPELAPVLLNGNRYIVRYPIARELIRQQTDAFRTTGANLRINNPKLEPYAFNDWSGGLGTKFIRPGHPEDRKGFYESSCMTIWQKVITKQLDSSGMTDPAADERIVASALFSGSLYGLWEPTDNAAAIDVIRASALSGVTWGAGATVIGETDIDDKVRGFDLIAAGDRMVAAVGLLNDILVRYSTNGTTWTAPSTTPPGDGNEWVSNSVMLADDHGAKLAYDGSNIVLAVHDAQNGLIEIWRSTNSGNTWTKIVSFGSGGGPTCAVPYLDTDDTVNIYVGSSEGLWMVDIAAATAQKVIEMPVAADNCRRATVHNGSLYIPVDYDVSAPFGMKKLTVSNGGRVIEDVGLDVKQGMPAELLGKVYWLRSFGPWLWACVGGGAASRNARMLTLDGLPDHGWQTAYRYATANDVIPWLDFIGLHLLYSRGGAANADPSDTHRLMNLLVLPTSSTSHSYQTDSSDLELPEFGGDAVEDSGGFFQVMADAEGLADAAEFIDLEYGVNAASPTTAGPTINNTDRSGKLGTSERGVSGRTIRQNLEFNGASAASPLLREWLLLFRKRPARLERYLVEIDIEATIRSEGAGQQRGYNTILNELNTIFDSQIAVPFIPDDDTGELQVEVTDYRFGDWTTAPPQSRDTAKREGTVSVVLEQIA